MRNIGIIILLVLCLTLLLFTGCKTNTVKPEIASGNLENQEDIDQSSNNSQSSSTGPVEEPVIEEDTEATGAVYPQQWATGDGTEGNPWANNCIKQAYDACPTDGTIFLRAGYYLVPSNSEYGVRINKSVNIVGEGIGKTIIVTSDAFGFYIDHVDYVTLKGFTIDGDAGTDGQYKPPILVSGCNYTLLEDIEVKNAAKYGIDAPSNNHSLFHNIYAHDNYNHGVHPDADAVGRNMYNVYRDIYSWNNGGGGFDDPGSEVANEYVWYNTYDNLQCRDNGESGIFISNQRSGVISNCFASNNGLNGFSTNRLEDFNIHDCVATGNTYSGMGVSGENINVDNCLLTLNDKNGIYFDIVNNANITNIIARNNNCDDSTYAGIEIDDSGDITLTSCQSYDDRETPLQAWGIKIEGTNTGISLLNCKLSPNKNGDIYNPAGAEVTVITEKMLAKF